MKYSVYDFFGIMYRVTFLIVCPEVQNLGCIYQRSPCLYYFRHPISLNLKQRLNVITSCEQCAYQVSRARPESRISIISQLFSFLKHQTDIAIAILEDDSSCRDND